MFHKPGVGDGFWKIYAKYQNGLCSNTKLNIKILKTFGIFVHLKKKTFTLLFFKWAAFQENS